MLEVDALINNSSTVSKKIIGLKLSVNLFLSYYITGLHLHVGAKYFILRMSNVSGKPMQHFGSLVYNGSKVLLNTTATI